VITIDGSEGEGGGQMVRNALALSLVTGQPFRIDNIRANRSKPGLMRQHVTAIEAACAIGSAVCEGVAVGARSIVFKPGRIVPGDYRFAVGTAGSAGLVLQTILPPLLLADRPSRLTIEGGTHNTHAPPFEFIDRTFLPLVRRMGPRVTARLVRHGFYPAGGGRIDIGVEPAPLTPVELIERGNPVDVSATAVMALLDDHIGRRELASARAILDWPEPAFRLERLADPVGPGNVLLLGAAFDHVTEIVTGFGQLGVPAQHIGSQAATRMLGYLNSAAFAGPYLADQLLLPMAMAGHGAFTTVSPTKHTQTSADIIRRFLDVAIRFERHPNGAFLVTIGA
jgi:RNA 3'-terminal phosphate cyclase (ATP)